MTKLDIDIVEEACNIIKNCVRENPPDIKNIRTQAYLILKYAKKKQDSSLLSI